MEEKVLKLLYYVKLNLRRSNIELEGLLHSFPIEDAIEFICLDETVVDYIDKFDCFREFADYLMQIKKQSQNKIISSITDLDIEASKRTSLNNNGITPEEMQLIFRALGTNLSLYERLYKDKIYKLETTLNRNVLLNIGRAKVFHLLGFNLIEWQNRYRQEVLSVIPEMSMIIDENYASMCNNDDARLYGALLDIINREDDIINAILDGSMPSRAFPLQKIKTKNYAFERLGLIDQSTGVVFYDSNSDPNPTKLKSGVMMLRDIVRDYNLSWIFNGYMDQRTISRIDINNGNPMNVKNASTLLIEPDNSNRFDGQVVSVTTGIGSIQRRDFDYKISVLGADAIPTEHFDEEEICRMAEKIVANFPKLNLTHLKEIIQIKGKKKNK